MNRAERWARCISPEESLARYGHFSPYPNLATQPDLAAGACAPSRRIDYDTLVSLRRSFNPVTDYQPSFGGKVSTARIVLDRARPLSRRECARPRGVLFQYRPEAAFPRSGSDLKDAEARHMRIWRRRGLASFVAARRNSGIADKYRLREFDFYLGKGRACPWQVEMLVPCRRCEPCREYHAAQWTSRTFAEWRVCMARPGCRVWHFTCTFSPAVHQRSRDLARAETARKGKDFDGLTAERQLSERLRLLYTPLVRKFLARVRKGNKAKRFAPGSFRFLRVCELHSGGGLNDGEPHFHCLFFETDAFSPLRYNAVWAAWEYDRSCGHFEFKLCDDEKAIWYVTKYLSKSVQARVIASRNFGDGIDPRFIAGSSAVERRGAGTAPTASVSEQVEHDLGSVTIAVEQRETSTTTPEAAPPRVEGAGGCDLRERSERLGLTALGGPGLAGGKIKDAASDLSGDESAGVNAGAQETDKERECRLSKPHAAGISGFPDGTAGVSAASSSPSVLGCKCPKPEALRDRLWFCEQCLASDDLLELQPGVCYCRECAAELDDDFVRWEEKSFLDTS